MSLQSAGWWPSFVHGLKVRPLSAWSAQLGVSEAELIAALIDADPGGPAQEAPWWPEALRLRADTPLRALARRFDTEPRRLRRALAREGLRAGGRELDRRGDPALAAFRGRLGKEPDAVLARAAGVAIEAVQGERRRLGIAPTTLRSVAPVAPPLVAPTAVPTAASLRLTPDEEAWIRGPEPMRRARVRPDADQLEVVRRPRSGAEMARPGSDTPRPGPLGPPFRAAASQPPPVPPPTSFGSEGTHAHRVSRDFFRERDSGELDRLLQLAPRPRDGRQRIVSAESLTVGPSRRPLDASGAGRVPASVTGLGPRHRVFEPKAEAPGPPTPVAPPSVAPAPVFFAPPAPVVPAPRASFVWHVRVPGDDAPMIVEAPDVGDAARIAAARLPPQAWANVAIVLAEVDTGSLGW
jgi:hypothetical protein